jgi:hypothetical protein
MKTSVTLENEARPHTLLVGMEISPATMEINMGVPQKTKNRTRTTI